ncbi:MAG: C39 family peptidase [Anaerolineae bacterium]|nr:C39 family peptidase [Anaerolineae bacterium]
MTLLPVSLYPQRQQTECLAACAAMVLAYLQVRASYKRLIKLLRIGPAGAPFRNLRYLESLGLSVSIERGEIETLRERVEHGFPPIVFVNTKELPYWRETTGHAMVVVGFDEDLIYLNDPAFADAPQIIPVSEFDLAWLELDQFYVIIEKK